MADRKTISVALNGCGVIGSRMPPRYSAPRTFRARICQHTAPPAVWFRWTSAVAPRTSRRSRRSSRNQYGSGATANGGSLALAGSGSGHSTRSTTTTDVRHGQVAGRAVVTPWRPSRVLNVRRASARSHHRPHTPSMAERMMEFDLKADSIACTRMKAPHRKHRLDDEVRNREAALDRTIEASFPASDPPSSIPNPDEDQHESRDHVDERHGQEDHVNRR